MSKEVFFLQAVKRKVTLTFLCLLFFTQVSSADVYQVRASYTPNPNDSSDNKFELSVINSWFCQHYATALCKANGVITVPFLEVARPPSLVAHHGPREGFMLRAASTWRTVDIRHEVTGHMSTVQVRVQGIVTGLVRAYRPSFSEAFPDAADGIEAQTLLFGEHPSLFGSCGANQHPYGPLGPYPNNMEGYMAMYYFSIPIGGSINCVKTAQVDFPTNFIPQGGPLSAEVALQIISPSPLSLESGVYKGSMPFLVGEGGDVDTGDVSGFVPSSHTLNFDFMVNHIFDVRFPAGSTLLPLVPEGGWMAWLQRGRKPTRLFRDQNFDIWTSTPFTIRTICEHGGVGPTCGIENEEGHKVSVEVSVTLPNAIKDSSHQPVHRYALSPIMSPPFSPEGYVSQRRATVHFEVPKDDMEKMLGHPGTRYAGNITIVFEAGL